MRKYFLYTCFLFVSFFCYDCKKELEINGLHDQLVTDQVFTTGATATSAVLGIYRNIKGTSLSYSQYVYAGLAADEIRNYFPGSSTTDEFNVNAIQVTDQLLPWTDMYNAIYQANSAIEGIEKSTTLDLPTKNQLESEALFLRAYIYFNLVNFFGDVPLITTTDVTGNASMKRAPAATVYRQIIADLQNAGDQGAGDFTFNGGQPTRVCKWAAAALLARVYLYTGDWVNAEKESSSVINAGLFQLVNPNDGIFLSGNNEAILQWANSSTDINSMATYFIYQASPVTVCTSSLLAAFEPNDLRKKYWLSSQVYNGDSIWYPYKFTTIQPTTSEQETPLRLGEQYLIRAEARAMQNNTSGSLEDLNIIRTTHGGLTPIQGLLTQSACIKNILQERRVELFAEGAHRWFDLKRLGVIDSVMQAEKPGLWKSSAALWPIPLSDIQKDPNLAQNPGY